MLVQISEKNEATPFHAVSIADQAFLKGAEIFSQIPASPASPVIEVQTPEKNDFTVFHMFTTACFALSKMPLKKPITFEKTLCTPLQTL